jgi:hypothetical protein
MAFNSADHRQEEIYFDCSTGTWVGRPSLKSYEEVFFSPSTFFTATSPFPTPACALQSLINEGFAAFHQPQTTFLCVVGNQWICALPVKCDFILKTGMAESVARENGGKTAIG